MTQHEKPKHAFEQYEWLARMDPDFNAARRQLAGQVWEPKKPALAIKYREIVAATVLAYRTYPSVESHFRSAVAAGATLREILEGLQAGATLGGFTVLHFAIPYLISLNEEFGDEIIDGPGAAKRTGGGKKPSTGPVSRGMREWAWLDKVDPDYDGARRDITALVWTPAEPALPVKVREMCACAILAYRAFPTIDGHFRRAVREGASVKELLEAMEVAALPGGFPLLHYALPFLMKLHEEVEAGTFA